MELKHILEEKNLESNLVKYIESAGGTLRSGSQKSFTGTSDYGAVYKYSYVFDDIKVLFL